MSDILSTGISSEIERGGSLQLDIRDGTTWVRQFVGTKSEMETRRSAESAPRSYLSPNGDGSWTLTLTYPYYAPDGGGPETETPTDTFELEYNDVQYPAIANPRLRYLMKADFPSATDREIEQYIQEARFASEKYKKFTDPTKASAYEAQVYADWGGPCTRWFLFNQLAMRGRDSYLISECVFRRTITAADPVQVKAAHDDASTIFTSAEVEAAENIPTSNGYFNLPSGMLWLKSHVMVTAAWRGKTQIRYHYNMGIEFEFCMFDSKTGGAAVPVNSGKWTHP